jgi:hypothetical protein
MAPIPPPVLLICRNPPCRKRSPVDGWEPRELTVICPACGEPRPAYEARCGADTPNGPCGAIRSKGSRRCKRHGGATPRGDASPHYRGGNPHADWVPPRYRKAYAAFMGDPDLMSMRRQVALLLAREEELAARLESAESGEAWDGAREALQWGERALTGGKCDCGIDSAMMRATLERLRGAIEGWDAEESAWKALHENMGQVRAAVTAEARQMEARRAYLTVEEALALVIKTAGAARQFVIEALGGDPDPRVLQRFAARMQAIFPTSQGAATLSLEPDYKVIDEHGEQSEGSGEQSAEQG